MKKFTIRVEQFIEETYVVPAETLEEAFDAAEQLFRNSMSIRWMDRDDAMAYLVDEEDVS